MTYEEYIQWAKNSLKELSELLGIPKAFFEKRKGEMIMIYGGIIFFIVAIILFLLGGCSTWKEAARDNYFGALLSLLLSIILFILSYYDK